MESMAFKKDKSDKEKMLGTVMDVAGLAEYQEGSIVSREIINKKTGTVTVFAFDEGEGLSEHSAPFDALVIIADGQAEITIDGRPNKLKAGEMIIMPADHPHSVKAIKKFKMLLIMIRS
jgi:quercetin dioxygenase-like cupin family protein